MAKSCKYFKYLLCTRNTVMVIVRQPEVKQMVQIDELEKWLRAQGAVAGRDVA
jgi:hypothetical protein